MTAFVLTSTKARVDSPLKMKIDNESLKGEKHDTAFAPTLHLFQRLVCTVVTVSVGRSMSVLQMLMFPWTLTGYELSRMTAATTAFPLVAILHDCGMVTHNTFGSGKFRANQRHS